MARAAGRRGDTVFATARDVTTIENFTHRHRLDVTDPEQVRAAVAAAISTVGRIDVLVNNAGHGMVGTVEEVTDEDLRRVLETNLFGVWRVTREVLPHLRRQGSGHIVQISSVDGVIGKPGHAAYSASKFALEGMSEALEQEVAPWGIDVTIVEPGPMRTDFAGRSLVMSEPIAAYAETSAGKTSRRYRDRHGLQPNDPDKAAAAILRVVDDEQDALRLLGLRLPLGAEAVGVIRGSLDRRLRGLFWGEEDQDISFDDEDEA